VNVRVKKGSDLPFLPIAVAAILVVVAIVLIVYGHLNSGSNQPVVAAGIPCDALVGSKVHYHVALQIVYHGTLTPIPAGIGITGGETAPTCFYWLHVHGANEDVIHIESPANKTFTLGDFFTVWSTWSVASGGSPVPFDAKHISTFTLSATDKLVVYLDAADGKGPQPYTGDPKKIVLKTHEVITVEIAPPDVNPPPAFDWTSGSYAGL
jgi:hypothetical protein